MVRLPVAWICLVAVSFASMPAFAATATMVQFGAFETRAEAEARLSEVKQKHAGLIGSMDVSIREVPIGSEGLTTYRTQAGPVASKAAAQSICAQMASNGDECYVVETAMTMPAAAVAKAAAPAETPKGTYTGAEQALGAAPKSLSTNDAATVTAPSIKLPAASAVAATAPSAPVAAPSAAATLPNNVAVVPPRDPRNIAALASATEDASALSPLAAPQGSDASAATPSGIPSAGMQAAMDKAVAEEAAASAAVAVQPVPAKSTWERLNPFASSTTAKPAPVPAPLPAPVALTNPPLPTPEPVKPAPVTITPALKPATVKLADTRAAEAPAPIAPVTITPTNNIPPKPPEAPVSPVVALAPAPAAPAPLLLPPPPAPLRGQPVPQPIATRPVPPSAMPEPLGVNVPPPPMIASVPGPNVQVEEAKRVPLSQGMAPVAMAPAPIVPQNAVVSLSPSATIGQKTIWAQLGSFSDAQEALAFWDNYRMMHPDFPVVRVRVTNAVSAVNRGDNRQWLRVGPFAREGFVSALCASLLNANGEPIRAGLQCGRVTDMGVAGTGDRIPGYLPGSRYKR